MAFIIKPIGKTLHLWTLVLFGLFLNVNAYSREDIVNLMNDLMYRNPNFSVCARPSVNQSLPLNISLSLYLISINSVNVVKQQISITASLFISWKDEYFRWNKTNYNGIEFFMVHQKDIWKPDLALLNSVSKMRVFGDDDLLTWVLYSGDVYWVPYEIFISICSVDITYFPFDEQTCSFEFGSWMISKDQIVVNLGPFGFNVSSTHKNDEWTITESTTTTAETISHATKVIFSLKIKRIPKYYILTIIIPVVLLTLLLLLTFIVPVDSGEKLGYSMTVLLSFSVFLTLVSDSFPVTSSTSILSSYLLILFSTGASIVLMTGVELRLHCRSENDKKTVIFVNIVKFQRWIRCKFFTNKPTKINPTPDREEIKHNDKCSEIDEESEENLTWNDVTNSLDVLLFCFYFIFLTIVTFVCTMLMIGGH